MNRLWTWTALAALSLLTGCVYVDGGSFDDTDGDTNTPPSVVLEARGGPFETGDRITVDASSTTDADGDELDFEWSVVDAEGRDVLFDRASSGRAIDFRAVNEGPFEITAGVDDGVNPIVWSTLTVRTGNNPPSINVATCANLQDMTRYQLSGDQLTIELGTTQQLCLDASPSSDPEDHELSFQWVVTSTPDSAADTVVNRSEMRLELDQTGTYEGFLEVTDAFGATATMDWLVLVR